MYLFSKIAKLDVELAVLRQESELLKQETSRLREETIILKQETARLREKIKILKHDVDEMKGEKFEFFNGWCQS